MFPSWNTTGGHIILYRFRSHRYPAMAIAFHGFRIPLATSFLPPFIPAPFCARSVCFLGSGVLLSLPSSPPHSFPLVWSMLLPPMKPYQDDRQHKILGSLRRWMNGGDLLLGPFILILSSSPGVRQWMGMVARPPDTHMVVWLAMTKCSSPAFLHGVRGCCIQLGLWLKHEARKYIPVILNLTPTGPLPVSPSAFRPCTLSLWVDMSHSVET